MLYSVEDLALYAIVHSREGEMDLTWLTGSALCLILVAFVLRRIAWYPKAMFVVLLIAALIALLSLILSTLSY